MLIKKLSFYIDTAKVTVKSDHLPLKKFLEKNTMNAKVKQLGSRTQVTEHFIRIHSRDPKYSGRYTEQINRDG